jgi:hypothetical protein
LQAPTSRNAPNEPNYSDKIYLRFEIPPFHSETADLVLQLGQFACRVRIAIGFLSVFGARLRLANNPGGDGLTISRVVPVVC